MKKRVEVRIMIAIILSLLVVCGCANRKEDKYEDELAEQEKIEEQVNSDVGKYLEEFEEKLKASGIDDIRIEYEQCTERKFDSYSDIITNQDEKIPNYFYFYKIKSKKIDMLYKQKENDLEAFCNIFEEIQSIRNSMSGTHHLYIENQEVYYYITEMGTYIMTCIISDGGHEYWYNNTAKEGVLDIDGQIIYRKNKGKNNEDTKEQNVGTSGGESSSEQGDDSEYYNKSENQTGGSGILPDSKKENVKKYDPYDVEDYDDPDDFAEEWGEEFGDGDYDDGYDDAYDYWEENH